MERTGWIVAAILLLLLIGGGIYFYLQIWPQLSAVSSLKQEKADLQSAKDTLVAEKAENVKKISELEEAKKSLSDANVTLTNQIIKLVGDRDAAKSSEVYFARVYRDALAANNKLSQDNEMLKKEIARLKGENESLAKENEQLKVQYNRLLVEKAGTETAKQAVENRIAALNKDIADANQDKETAEAKALKAAQDLTKTDAEKAVAESKVVSLNVQVADALADKNALQSQLNDAKKALEAAEKRLASSDKLVAKVPSADTVKENLALKSEIKFLYSLILVATSSTEKNLSEESRQKATNLMVRMTYQPDADIRYNAAKSVMKEMPLDGAQSIELMKKAWHSWEKANE
ncbi:MAG: hypothetical protein PHW31_02995 [Candidatus Pacebacteria bacterium]|nr:hypothetical protein [Candidatus Paceibacterota bacterium]